MANCQMIWNGQEKLFRIFAIIMRKIILDGDSGVVVHSFAHCIHIAAIFFTLSGYLSTKSPNSLEVLVTNGRNYTVWA